jgi:hypothetical protein
VAETDLGWYADVFAPIPDPPTGPRAPHWLDEAVWPERLTFPPLPEPTDAELRDALTAWASLHSDPRAPGLLVRQYGGAKLSDLDAEARRFLYHHLRTEYLETLLG